jgi:hypothetical protein
MVSHPYSQVQFRKVLSVEVKPLQSTPNSPKPFFFLRVSTLAHVEICSKRSKIESFNHTIARIPYKKGSALAIGKKQHAQYGQFNVDFDRDRLRANLAVYKVKGAFQKVMELPECTVVLRGDYDDLRIITKDMQKLVSFIEVKTTGKKYMWALEVRAAIRQLQIYLWLLKDLCEAIGYPLWKRHYLEIFSQSTGRLLKRLPVEYDQGIEQWIEAAVLQFLGLAPMTIAPFKYCILCPAQVKERCEYYTMRKGSQCETL